MNTTAHLVLSMKQQSSKVPLSSLEEAVVGLSAIWFKQDSDFSLRCVLTKAFQPARLQQNKRSHTNWLVWFKHVMQTQESAN